MVVIVSPLAKDDSSNGALRLRYSDNGRLEVAQHCCRTLTARLSGSNQCPKVDAYIRTWRLENLNFSAACRLLHSGSVPDLARRRSVVDGSAHRSILMRSGHLFLGATTFPSSQAVRAIGQTLSYQCNCHRLYGAGPEDMLAGTSAVVTVVRPSVISTACQSMATSSIPQVGRSATIGRRIAGYLASSWRPAVLSPTTQIPASPPAAIL
ncbi:hypothetical protein ACVWZV_008945 [Bradyrhizobium sp. GM5.1]